MKEFIEYLVKELVQYPEDATVEEIVQGTYVRCIITVAEDDMGKVIGRGGKTIKGLRALAKAKAIKDDIKVNIELEDPYRDPETGEINKNKNAQDEDEIENVTDENEIDTETENEEDLEETEEEE